MSQLALFGVTTTGASGSFDNVKITETRQKRTFGLFIGVQDTAEGKPTYRGDVMADKLYTDFVGQGNTARRLIANLDSGGKITKEQIDQELAAIKSQMSPGDSFVFYVTGHGYSSFNALGGAELINLGDFLYDTQLYESLNTFDRDGKYEKRVFLDACHSGGFWDFTTDPKEANFQGNPTHSLNQLTNIAVFASAPESQESFYNGNTGKSFFGMSIDTAIANNKLDIGAADLYQYLVETGKLAWHQDNNLVYFTEQGFGDQILANSDLINFVFNSNINAGSVPEPSSLILVLAALGAAAAFRQRRKFSEFQ